MLLFVAMFVLIVGVAALAIDYGHIYRAQSTAQDVADAAAISAARELVLAQADIDKVENVARLYADANLETGEEDLEEPVITARVLDDRMGVEVVIDRRIRLFLGSVLGADQAEVSARSVARLPARTPICVLGLSRDDRGTIDLEKNARLTAVGCALFSNSTHPRGLDVRDSAKVSASFICSAGGKAGAKWQMTPDPVTDCPQVDDPLADRPMPHAGGCHHNNVVVDGDTVALAPGIYCGGLTVTRGGRATLQPGVFVFKDGPLVVDRGGTLEGVGVGLYFNGDKATMLFAYDSTISLEAPVDGIMAGILILEDRGSAKLREFRIQSDDARTLLGTIYLPNSRLVLDSSKPVADQSAYTVIVARRLELREGPNLVLNTDYDGTDVPVPEGLGPSAKPPFLGHM